MSHNLIVIEVSITKEEQTQKEHLVKVNVVGLYSSLLNKDVL